MFISLVPNLKTKYVVLEIRHHYFFTGLTKEFYLVIYKTNARYVGKSKNTKLLSASFKHLKTLKQIFTFQKLKPVNMSEFVFALINDLNVKLIKKKIRCDFRGAVNDYFILIYHLVKKFKKN